MQAVTQFQTEPPKVPKVRVIAIDLDTNKSKSVTLYDTTPESVIGAIKGEQDRSSAPRRRKAG